MVIGKWCQHYKISTLDCPNSGIACLFDKVNLVNKCNWFSYCMKGVFTSDFLAPPLNDPLNWVHNSSVVILEQESSCHSVYNLFMKQWLRFFLRDLFSYKELYEEATFATCLTQETIKRNSPFKHRLWCWFCLQGCAVLEVEHNIRVQLSYMFFAIVFFHSVCIILKEKSLTGENGRLIHNFSKCSVCRGNPISSLVKV